MYCNKCGKSLDDGVKFCSKCGKQVRDVEERTKQQTSNIVIPSQKTDLEISNLHKDKKEEIQKLEKSLKNVGDSGIALGWFQLFVTIVLFSIGYFTEDLGEFQFGLADLAIYLPFSITLIILSKRIKTLKSIRIRKYLYVLLILTLPIIVLSIIGGGKVGFLWFIYVYYLYKAIKSTSELNKITGYFNEKDIKIKIKKPHWIGLSIITAIFLIIGILFDLDKEGFTPEFKSEFISSCIKEAGGNQYNDYCNCAYDYVVKNYTYKEVLVMSNYDTVAKACSEHIPQ